MCQVLLILDTGKHSIHDHLAVHEEKQLKEEVDVIGIDTNSNSFDARRVLTTHQERVNFD